MSFIDDTERIFAVTSEAIGAIGDAPLTAPTPCSDWDLRALLNHLINANRAITRTVAGEPVEPDALDPGVNANADFGGGDPRAAYDRAASEALRVFTRPGALDRVLPRPDGDQPAAFLATLSVGDSLLHAWDIGRASGRDYDLPEDVAQSGLTGLEPLFPIGLKHGVFGPAVPVPAGSSASDRLVGLAGRDPNWRPA